MFEMNQVDITIDDVKEEILIYERLLQNNLDQCHDLNNQDLIL